MRDLVVHAWTSLDGFSVDEETGVVTVHKIWAAHDCGRALNPVAVEGQVIGSVWMGLGQAMQEEMVWKAGLLMNAGLLEYRSPSSVESPEIECIIVESIDPEGPFGAKEAGEGSLAATIPAISNAIYDAVGVRLREAPFTPERVLAALRVMPQDGFPIYDRSDAHPGAFLATCHSGVTLAANHAMVLPPLIDAGTLAAENLGAFSARRFHVSPTH